jgi:hypothetical protein
VCFDGTPKHLAPNLAAITLAATFWIVPISIQPSANSGVTISVDQAQAYPLWATSTHLTPHLSTTLPCIDGLDQLLRVRRHEAEEDADVVRVLRGSTARLLRRDLDGLDGRRGTKANPIEGEHTLFGFLTTEANDVVGAVHPKAMPVILTSPEDFETWMTAPAEEALKLQRPLAEGELTIVARGERKDEPLEAA